MLKKIMFYPAILIITFSVNVFCIRNQKEHFNNGVQNDDDDDGKQSSVHPIMTINLFPPPPVKQKSVEARQFFSDEYSIHNTKFAFPSEDHQHEKPNQQNHLGYDMDIPLPTSSSSEPIKFNSEKDDYFEQQKQHYQSHKRERPNGPYQTSLNAGEYPQQYTVSSSIAVGNYPSSSSALPIRTTSTNNVNTIYGSTISGNNRDVPKYDTYNDGEYSQDNYAHGYYNYPNNKRPNYFNSQRPTGGGIGYQQSLQSRPPPSPPYNRYRLQGAPNYPPQTLYPLAGNGGAPGGYPLNHHQGYYPPNYAGQFNNYRPFSNPLTNFFNSFGSILGGGGGAGGAAGQFSKALEDITRNDDLQCVPKLLCDMIGDPNRRMQLPSFVTAPAFTALIAAVPSISPVLSFGRAALIGFTSGGETCTTSYPKCPRNEDDLLYYLNNHRGGFFKFFNGGGSFGDDSAGGGDYQQQNLGQQGYPQRPQYPGQQNQGASGSESLSGLQSLADAFNQGGGINLSNLGSNVGILSQLASLVMGGNQNSYKNAGGNTSVKDSSNDKTPGFSDVVGNLLTGLVGNRFATRRISKRSTEDNVEISDDHNTDELSIEVEKNNSSDISAAENIEEKKKIVKYLKKYDPLRDSAKKNDTKSEKELKQMETDNEENIEGRILNNPNPIYSDQDEDILKVSFPQDYTLPSDGLRDSKRVKFSQHEQRPVENYGSVLKFPQDDDEENDYDDEDRFTKYRKGKRINIRNKEKFESPNQYYDEKRERPNKMIFPDRTGTGNLRFDNDEFYGVRDDDRDGKILTGSRPTKYRPNEYDDRYDSRPSEDRERDRDRDQYGDRDYDRNRDRERDRYGNRDHDRDRDRIRDRDRDRDRENYYNRYTSTSRPYNNRYDETTRRPSLSHYSNRNDYGNSNQNNYQVNRYPSPYQQATTRRPYKTTREPNRNIYVTNSRGVIEYYINPRGEKVYV